MNLSGRKLVIETGKMAKQASGSVVLTYGETVLLVTATASKGNAEDKIKTMKDAGITIAKSPAEIGKTLLKKLSL